MKGMHVHVVGIPRRYAAARAEVESVTSTRGRRVVKSKLSSVSNTRNSSNEHTRH